MATEDDRLAHDLAAEAGRRLIDLRARGGQPDDLRKAGDRLSHEFLAAELARLRPGDWVLSEEAADNPARLAADRVWIVDPLDGTREFGDADRTDWAVHVALWERSGPGQGRLTVGAVALPAAGEVLSTVAPPAAPPGPLPAMAELLGADLVPLGSAGAKVAAVLQGHADAYVHAGGQYEWDSAAPVAVTRAAGFHASRIDGRELTYNQADLLMPDILVCIPALAGGLLDAISSAQASEADGGQR